MQSCAVTCFGKPGGSPSKPWMSPLTWSYVKYIVPRRTLLGIWQIKANKILLFWFSSEASRVHSNFEAEGVVTSSGSAMGWEASVVATCSEKNILLSLLC